MASSVRPRDQLLLSTDSTNDTVFGVPVDARHLAHGFANPIKSSKSFLRLKMYLGLVMIDGLALYAAFTVARLLRFGSPFAATATDVLVVLLPMYFVLAFNGKAYAIDVLTSPKAGSKRAARSLLMAAGLVIGGLFYLKTSADFSRFVMALGVCGSLVTVAGARWVFGQYMGKRHKWRFTNEILFVDGVSVFPTKGEIVVFADRAQLRPSTDDPVLLDRMGSLLRHCDRVVLACHLDRRAAWAAMMKGINVNVEVLAPELDELGALAIGRAGDRSTVLVSHGPLGLRDRLIKRAFDIAVSLHLLIWVAPLFAIIALAIKLESPGSVFFRQQRTGLGNRMFSVLKFRTMHARSEDKNANQLTQKNDPRVTRVGNFLRRTSLDELPQLLNVLVGHMSMVGPRPHAPGALAGEALYWEVDHRYWHRHVVKPGLTGLAQVRGFRGTTFAREDLVRRLQADLEYLSDWSIWRDIGLVLSTVKVVFHKNAF